MTNAELKNYADRNGAAEALRLFGRETSVELPMDGDRLQTEIEELALSVRAFNGLKRAGINNIGQLCNAIMDDGGLERIRNLGKTSIFEIKKSLLEYGYERMTDSQKDDFWRGITGGNAA